MIIELTEFLNAVSRATDYVEAEVLNVPKHHVRRVAVLTHWLAERAGMDAETVYALTQAAMLHDCALPEFLGEESPGSGEAPEEINMAAHNDHLMAKRRKAFRRAALLLSAAA